MRTTETPTTSAPGPQHEPTIAWLVEQPDLLLDYAGEWVALIDRRIVAHGPSVIEVVRQARAIGVDDPLLVPVPPSRVGPRPPNPGGRTAEPPRPPNPGGS